MLACYASSMSSDVLLRMWHPMYFTNHLYRAYNYAKCRNIMNIASYERLLTPSF